MAILTLSAWILAAIDYSILYVASGHFWNWWWLWNGPIIRIDNYHTDRYKEGIAMLKEQHSKDIFDCNFGVIKCRNNKVAVFAKLVL
jgi:hypothetical protein